MWDYVGGHGRRGNATRDLRRCRRTRRAGRGRDALLALRERNCLCDYISCEPQGIRPGISLASTSNARTWKLAGLRLGWMIGKQWVVDEVTGEVPSFRWDQVLLGNGGM